MIFGEMTEKMQSNIFKVKFQMTTMGFMHKERKLNSRKSKDLVNEMVINPDLDLTTKGSSYTYLAIR